MYNVIYAPKGYHGILGRRIQKQLQNDRTHRFQHKVKQFAKKSVKNKKKPCLCVPMTCYIRHTPQELKTTDCAAYVKSLVHIIQQEITKNRFLDSLWKLQDFYYNVRII